VRILPLSPSLFFGLLFPPPAIFLSPTTHLGQESYSLLRDQYIRTGQGFLVIFSLSDRESFNEATELREQIARVKDTEDLPLVLVGNKSDLVKSRVIAQSDAQHLAESWQCPYVEVSVIVCISC